MNRSFETSHFEASLDQTFWASTRYWDPAYSAAYDAAYDAAYFVESRDSVHGLHSLRVHTVETGHGLVFTHSMCPREGFPLQAGAKYTLSVWARGISFDAQSEPLQRPRTCPPPPRRAAKGAAPECWL